MIKQQHDLTGRCIKRTDSEALMHTLLKSHLMQRGNSALCKHFFTLSEASFLCLEQCTLLIHKGLKFQVLSF